MVYSVNLQPVQTQSKPKSSKGSLLKGTAIAAGAGAVLSQIPVQMSIKSSHPGSEAEYVKKQVEYMTEYYKKKGCELAEKDIKDIAETAKSKYPRVIEAFKKEIPTARACWALSGAAIVGGCYLAYRGIKSFLNKRAEKNQPPQLYYMK